MSYFSFAVVNREQTVVKVGEWDDLAGVYIAAGVIHTYESDGIDQSTLVWQDQVVLPDVGARLHGLPEADAVVSGRSS